MAASGNSTTPMQLATTTVIPANAITAENESASRGTASTATMVTMPITVKKAARAAAGGSAAWSTDSVKNATSSIQHGLKNTEITRGLANAMMENSASAPSMLKPSWLTMSPPPSEEGSGPPGWNGRNETMTVVSSTAARIVATRSVENASAIEPRSVFLRLPVLLIGIAEFREHAADRDVDGIHGGRWRAGLQQPRQSAERRGGEQR